MGGVARTIRNIFGGAESSAPKVVVPEVPNYEEERKKAEEEALRNRNRLKALGMSGTILGGAYGADEGVTRKKLLGE